jgi:uncharacterized membrane protein (DUF106 family)
MLIMMMLMLLIMADPSLSRAMGEGMAVLLTPTIGFGGHMPVLSILLAGLITGMLSTGLRHWSTDYIALERGRILQRTFNKEMMDARARGDVDRVDRLRRAQPFMMSHTMSAQYATMKPAVGTMVVALAVYGWMNVFLLRNVQTTAVSLPWAVSWPLPAGSLQMMFLYAVMSLPVTLVASNALKLYRFRNFDPAAELPAVPTVADLVRRAEGEVDDEATVASEARKARRRLREASGAEVEEDDGEDAVIEDADEDDVEIVEAEEEAGKGAGAGAEGGEPGPGDEGASARGPLTARVAGAPRKGRPKG